MSGDAVGTFRRTGDPSFVQTMMTVMLAFGAFVTMFGAMGGPFFFDTMLAAEKRA